jgi:hypothetical protein
LSPKLEQAVLAGKQRRLAWPGESLSLYSPEEIDAAERYIAAHPDISSVCLLVTLREEAPERYRALSKKTKAAILCDALRQFDYLNAFSLLRPDGGTDDGMLGTALVETGPDALPHLQSLLSDEGTAMIVGFSDRRMSEAYVYRRCDYAYRYASLILGREPAFDLNPNNRDLLIAKLKAEMAEQRLLPVTLPGVGKE